MEDRVTLMKEIKENLNKWTNIPCLWIEILNFVGGSSQTDLWIQ